MPENNFHPRLLSRSIHLAALLLAAVTVALLLWLRSIGLLDPGQFSTTRILLLPSFVVLLPPLLNLLSWIVERNPERTRIWFARLGYVVLFVVVPIACFSDCVCSLFAHDRITIPLSESEAAALPLLAGVISDYPAKLGPQCTDLLHRGLKLELEAITSYQIQILDARTLVDAITKLP